MKFLRWLTLLRYLWWTNGRYTDYFLICKYKNVPYNLHQCTYPVMMMMIWVFGRPDFCHRWNGASDLILTFTDIPPWYPIINMWQLIAHESVLPNDHFLMLSTCALICTMCLPFATLLRNNNKDKNSTWITMNYYYSTQAWRHIIKHVYAF